jgi:hypothetical protein
MAPARKVVDMAASVAMDLTFRGFTIAQSTDTNGNPNIVFGSIGAGAQCGTIVFKNPTMVGVDSLGNTQDNFANVLIQLCLESDASTADVADNVILTGANCMDIMGQLALHGAEVDLYLVDNGTSPTFANLTSGGVLVKAFNPSYKYKQMGQQ